MPFMFLCGAAVEWLMINWRPNGVNFYDTYRKNNLERKEKFLSEEIDEMSLRVPIFSYIKASVVSILFGLAGAQTVHRIYKPLEGFQEEIDQRKKEIRAEKARQNSENNT
ncbi:Small integral membrane protein 4 [Mactra antiquata]